MFEMSAAQKQAFRDATSGVSAQTFNHIVLGLIGLFATVWLLFFFIGIWHALQNHEQDLGDALLKLAVALLVYIAVGSMIFYHL